MTNCKNHKLGCNNSTMQILKENEDWQCLDCDTIEEHAEELHDALHTIKYEPLDGDATQTVAKILLSKLNELNGNK